MELMPYKMIRVQPEIWEVLQKIKKDLKFKNLNDVIQALLKKNLKN